MSRAPFAIWDPISGDVGPYTGGPMKVVHHKTQGDSYAGARAAFKANKTDPTFTVAPENTYQHTDTMRASRSLRNAAGGVETNRDGVIAIEVVGWSGEDSAPATLMRLVQLLQWIEKEHGIPWVWPEGRPPQTSAFYGENNGERHASLWDKTSGHYGHSQVPENSHWDPAYTDYEWAVLNDGMRPQPASTNTWPFIKEGEPMEVDVQIVPVEVDLGTTDSEGRANLWVPYPKRTILGDLPEGRRPNADGDYKTPDVAYAEEGDGTVISVEEWYPNTPLKVDIRVVR